MIWSDLINSIFDNSGSDGSGVNAAAQYGLGQIAAQVPYIGPYLGAYLTGRGEELYDLTHQQDGKSEHYVRKSPSDPWERVPGYFDPEPDLPPGMVDLSRDVIYISGPVRRDDSLTFKLAGGGAPRQDLRLADNSGIGDTALQVSIDSSGRVGLPWSRPENTPVGRSELSPWMPVMRQKDPLDEVTVVGIRPERNVTPTQPSSDPSPSRGLRSGVPPTRPQPTEHWQPFEQTWDRRRNDAATVPPGWVIKGGVAAPSIQDLFSESVPRTQSDKGPETETPPQYERDVWSRGGTGLAGGLLAVGFGFALVSNPVGWVALAGALMFAGGVAASSASSVELWASYRGKTTVAQDAAMNEAVAATLGYTGGGLWSVAGGTVGAVVANDSRKGFETGGVLGSLPEGFMALPGAVRAVPRVWNAAVPWGQALLMAPGTMFLSAGGVGGPSVRSSARLVAARRRAASAIRSVEILGTNPVFQREAAWAKYQVGATGSARETMFLVTYVNGEQRIVAADHFLRRADMILEAKYGNMGQMFNAEHEARIMLQAMTYVDISSHTGGRVRYLISTESGAINLAHRFALDFPAEMASGQLGVFWVPFKP